MQRSALRLSAALLRHQSHVATFSDGCATPLGLAPPSDKAVTIVLWRTAGQRRGKCSSLHELPKPVKPKGAGAVGRDEAQHSSRPAGHHVSCYGQKRDTPFRQCVLAARKSRLRRPHARLEWQFVVAVVTAIILAAAGAGTIYALVHRPVAGSHPPVVELVAAPSLAAPEVSRPLTPDPPVAAQQPTEPQEVKSPAEASHIPRWARGLQPMCRRPRLGRSTMKKRGNSLH